MTRMKRLDLSHTTISGDLEHLRPLRQLRTLRLSDTLVTGDLQSLQASQLQVLALEDGGGGGGGGRGGCMDSAMVIVCDPVVTGRSIVF